MLKREPRFIYLKRLKMFPCWLQLRIQALFIKTIFSATLFTKNILHGIGLRKVFIHMYLHNYAPEGCFNHAKHIGSSVA